MYRPVVQHVRCSVFDLGSTFFLRPWKVNVLFLPMALTVHRKAFFMEVAVNCRSA